MNFRELCYWITPVYSQPIDLKVLSIKVMFWKELSNWNISRFGRVLLEICSIQAGIFVWLGI